MTLDDTYVYKYDAENRLVEMDGISDGVVATYAYDGNSLRTVKVWGADRWYYLYSGSQLLSEFEDSSSNTYTAGTTPGTVGSDSLALILYQHPDHLSTRIATDNSGNYAASQARYPFGDAWYGASWLATASVTRKFTSYYLDTEAGAAQNNYALARVHGARFGRFFMADPVRGTQKIPQRLNRYSYAANNPVNLMDPRGLCTPANWEDGGCGTNCDVKYQTCTDYVDCQSALNAENHLREFQKCFVDCFIGLILGPEGFATCEGICLGTLVAELEWDSQAWAEARLICKVQYDLCNQGKDQHGIPCAGGAGGSWFVGGGGGGDLPWWAQDAASCDPSSDNWLDCMTGVSIARPHY